MNFFESICTVAGRAVKANQEMILRLVWMNEEQRHKTMLEVLDVSRASIAVKDFPPGAPVLCSLCGAGRGWWGQE